VRPEPASHESSPYEPQRIRYPPVNAIGPALAADPLGPGPNVIPGVSGQPPSEIVGRERVGGQRHGFTGWLGRCRIPRSTRPRQDRPGGAAVSPALWVPSDPRLANQAKYARLYSISGEPGMRRRPHPCNCRNSAKCGKGSRPYAVTARKVSPADRPNVRASSDAWSRSLMRGPRLALAMGGAGGRARRGPIPQPAALTVARTSKTMLSAEKIGNCPISVREPGIAFEEARLKIPGCRVASRVRGGAPGDTVSPHGDRGSAPLETRSGRTPGPHPSSFTRHHDDARHGISRWGRQLMAPRPNPAGNRGTRGGEDASGLPACASRSTGRS
jgi:hypothetical protein